MTNSVDAVCRPASNVYVVLTLTETIKYDPEIGESISERLSAIEKDKDIIRNGGP